MEDTSGADLTALPPPPSIQSPPAPPAAAAAQAPVPDIARPKPRPLFGRSISVSALRSDRKTLPTTPISPLAYQKILNETTEVGSFFSFGNSFFFFFFPTSLVCEIVSELHQMVLFAASCTAFWTHFNFFPYCIRVPLNVCNRLICCRSSSAEIGTSGMNPMK
jgi:hypothetical protein